MMETLEVEMAEVLLEELSLCIFALVGLLQQKILALFAQVEPLQILLRMHVLFSEEMD